LLRKWYFVGVGKMGNKNVALSLPGIIGDTGSDRVPSVSATSEPSPSPVEGVKEKEARALARARYCGDCVNDRSSSKVWDIVPNCFKADFGRERRAFSSTGEEVSEGQEGNVLSLSSLTTATAEVSI
jgi:hypothetical protein